MYMFEFYKGIEEGLQNKQYIFFFIRDFIFILWYFNIIDISIRFFLFFIFIRMQ